MSIKPALEAAVQRVVNGTIRLHVRLWLDKDRRRMEQIEGQIRSLMSQGKYCPHDAIEKLQREARKLSSGK